jgi:hypothetical protein
MMLECVTWSSDDARHRQPRPRVKDTPLVASFDPYSWLFLPFSMGHKENERFTRRRVSLTPGR